MSFRFCRNELARANWGRLAADRRGTLANLSSLESAQQSVLEATSITVNGGGVSPGFNDEAWQSVHVRFGAGPVQCAPIESAAVACAGSATEWDTVGFVEHPLVYDAYGKPYRAEHPRKLFDATVLLNGPFTAFDFTACDAYADHREALQAAAQDIARIIRAIRFKVLSHLQTAIDRLKARVRMLTEFMRALKHALNAWASTCGFVRMCRRWFCLHGAHPPHVLDVLIATLNNGTAAYLAA